MGLRSCSLIKHISLGSTFITLCSVCSGSAHSNSSCQGQTAAKAQRGHQQGVLKPDQGAGLAGSRGNGRRRQGVGSGSPACVSSQPAQCGCGERSGLPCSPPPKQSVPGDMLVCISQVRALRGWGVAICGDQKAGPWLGRELCCRTSQKDGPKWAVFKTEQAEPQASLICQDSRLLLFRSMFPEKPIAPG